MTYPNHPDMIENRPAPIESLSLNNDFGIVAHSATDDEKTVRRAIAENAGELPPRCQNF